MKMVNTALLKRETLRELDELRKGKQTMQEGYDKLAEQHNKLLALFGYHVSTLPEAVLVVDSRDLEKFDLNANAVNVRKAPNSFDIKVQVVKKETQVVNQSGVIVDTETCLKHAARYTAGKECPLCAAEKAAHTNTQPRYQ